MMKNLLVKLGGALVASPVLLPTVAPSASSPKLGFVIDATGSRAAMWQAAQEIQAGMFQKIEAQGVTLWQRVTCYRGSRVQSSEWVDAAEKLVSFMRGITCDPGTTQIALALSVYVGEKGLKAVCLITDSVEDDPAQIETIARLLGSRGVRVFCFQDGENPSAETHLRMVAKVSGGAYARFTSKADLAALCEFVASFAARPLDASALLLTQSKATPQVEQVARQLALTFKGGK